MVLFSSYHSKQRCQRKVHELWQKEFASPVTSNHSVILTCKLLQLKTKVSNGCCDENPALASITPLPIPELNQKKIYKKRSAKNEAKVKQVVNST